MNIINKLKNIGISMSLRYYGTDDLATGWQVRYFIENDEFIREYFENYTGALEDMDNYIDYLFLKTASNYKEIIPIVREDIAEQFDLLIKYLISKLQMCEISNLAKYIKINYKNILTYEYKKEKLRKFDVIDATIELIKKFCVNEFEPIEFLIDKFSYKIYDDFDSYKKIFNKSKDLYLYDLLLTKEKLEKDMTYRLNKIKNVLTSLKEKNLQKYKETITIICNTVEEKSFNTSTDRVMNTYFDIVNLMKFLSSLGAPEYYKFEQEMKKQKIIMDEHLKKSGHSTEFEISIKPFVDAYENKDIEWYIKSLSITHTKDKEDMKKLISNLEYAIKYYEKSEVMDSVSTNIETDKLFTYSTINNFSMIMFECKHIVNYMIQDNKRLDDLLGYILAGVNSYFGSNSYFYKEKDYE